MIRRPPRSTLFLTTLFRSLERRAASGPRAREGRCRLHRAVSPAARGRGPLPDGDGRAQPVGDPGGGPRRRDAASVGGPHGGDVRRLLAPTPLLDRGRDPPHGTAARPRGGGPARAHSAAPPGGSVRGGVRR